MAIDRDRAEAAVRELLFALDYDPDSEGLRDTPGRVARSMVEMTSGRDFDSEEVLGTRFASDGYDEVVLLKDIAFYSTCEHHLLPFHGVAHVAYVPSHEVVGLSKLARLVDAHAKRLQIQERMTRSIAADLERVLGAKGVGVVVEARHLCMCARGVSKQGATMTTSVMLGCFREKPEARAELMGLLRR